MIVAEFGPRKFPEYFESDIQSVTDTKNGLTILIDTINEHGQQLDLKVFFSYVRGYRYLDEGDLLCYWESNSFNTKYHIFKILSGGWSNGELVQSGLLSVSSAIQEAEWFIMTTNGCMNILSNVEPIAEYI